MRKGADSGKSRKGGGDLTQRGTGGGGGFAGRAVPKAPPKLNTVCYSRGSEVPAEAMAEWEKTKGLQDVGRAGGMLADGAVSSGSTLVKGSEKVERSMDEPGDGAGDISL
jgi:hypothetical protein